MGRASDVLAGGSGDNRAVPKTPASWLLSADQSQTDAPLPGGSAPHLNRITNPPIELHDLHPPTPADCGQRPSADGVLLRRNRTIRPPQSVRDFLSGAPTSNQPAINHTRETNLLNKIMKVLLRILAVVKPE